MVLGRGLRPEANRAAFHRRPAKETEAARPTEEPPKQAAYPTYPLAVRGLFGDEGKLLIGSVLEQVCGSVCRKVFFGATCESEPRHPVRSNVLCARPCDGVRRFVARASPWRACLPTSRAVR